MWVLQGADLLQAPRPTIGETLARTPGVSSTWLSPNTSRPVFRGLQGYRVYASTDGIGSILLSNTSVDHAVAIDDQNRTVAFKARTEGYAMINAKMPALGQRAPVELRAVRQQPVRRGCATERIVPQGFRTARWT